MKATLFMAISANGFVARQDGDEDFLPKDNWVQLLEFANKYGHLIWGRKTFETVKSWGDDYLDSLKDVPIIIVSKSNNASTEKNVTICQSPEEALRVVESKNYPKAFLFGGPSLNTSFIKSNLVDEIILNYNSTILATGIPLFSSSDFEVKMTLKNVKEISPSIVQLHYSVNDIIQDTSTQ